MKPHPFLVIAAMLCAVRPVSADLVLHYTCEEDSGSLFDSVAVVEAVPTDLGHLYMIPGPVGFGEAVGLVANGSWQMSVADSAVVRNLANDFTVASWVYIDQTLATGKTGTNPLLNRIIGDDIAWDGDGWSMAVWTDGRVRFTKNGIVDIDLGAAGTFPPDQWVHFAATVSSTAGTTLYVNGVPVGSNGNTVDCNTGLGNNGAEDAYALGRSYGAGEEQWFAGSIDDVRVYNHVLVEAEVQSLMVPPRDPALVTNFNYAADSDGAALDFDVPIRNGGENLALNVSGAGFSGADAADFTPGALPPSLLPGEDGVFSFSLSPSSGGGTYVATLTLNSNDPERPMFEVAVEITVKDPSIVVPAGGDFGLLDFGTPAVEQAAQIGNAGGTQNLEISGVDVTGPDAASFTVTAFPATVTPGVTGELRVEFDAAGGGGPFTAQLEIASNDVQSPTTIVPLSAVVSRVHSASYLLSYFTFDNPAVLGDDSGTFNNDGTPVGDAAYTASGRFAGALALDGDGDSITVGGAADYSSLDDNAEGFTAAAWINLDAAAAGHMRIFSTTPPAGGWGVGTWGGAARSSSPPPTDSLTT